MQVGMEHAVLERVAEEIVDDVPRERVRLEPAVRSLCADHSSPAFTARR